MAVMFLKERRSPVRRVFSLFSCGRPSMHVACGTMDILNKPDTENWRGTGGRRSLEK